MPTSIDTVPLTPESMGQEICKTGKALPVRGGIGEAVIEAGVNYEILPHRVRRGPQISDRIAVSQWLREVPHLARDGKLADRMRDRERLAKLRSPQLGLIILLLYREAVHVEVKAAQVIAQEDRRALHEGAEVEFRRWARIQPPQVLAGDRWPLVLISI